MGSGGWAGPGCASAPPLVGRASLSEGGGCSGVPCSSRGALVLVGSHRLPASPREKGGGQLIAVVLNYQFGLGAGGVCVSRIAFGAKLAAGEEALKIFISRTARFYHLLIYAVGVKARFCLTSLAGHRMVASSSFPMRALIV